MNIFITFLLCVNFAYSAFAQERKDVQALIQQLQDRDKQARIAAIKEVKRLGVEAKAAIPALALLLKEGDDDLREGAAEALGKMGEEAKAASPALTEALKDRNDRVRSNSAYALGQIGVEARLAAPALGELLKDQSAWARGNAAFALGKVGEAKPYLTSLIELLKAQQDRPGAESGGPGLGRIIEGQQRTSAKLRGGLVRRSGAERRRRGAGADRSVEGSG